MAIELEDQVMREIGLGNHYSWFNGSGSCPYLAREAVKRLPAALEKHELTLAPAWAAHLQRALKADSVSQYRLTNTWVACSYAIQDAIYRSEGDDGFEPVEDFHFMDDRERARWEMQNAPMHERYMFMEKFMQRVSGDA